MPTYMPPYQLIPVHGYAEGGVGSLALSAKISVIPSNPVSCLVAHPQDASSEAFLSSRTKMSFRVISEPDASAKVPKQCSNTQLAPQSDDIPSHGGENHSGVVESLRRSLRYSSSRAASGNRMSTNCSTRMIKRHALAPLSHGSGPLSHTSHPRKSHHRRSGSSTSKTSTSTARSAVNQTSSPPVRKRGRLSGHHYLATPRSPARFLLSQAREAVALRIDWLGRKPSIMDIILDSRSPAVDIDEEVLIEAIRRKQEFICPSRHQYDFTDKLSLAMYWSDEAARLGMQASGGVTTKFPDSDERSTASWSPSLDLLGCNDRKCASAFYADDT